MDEKTLLARIDDLVTEEHQLRAAVQSGRLDQEQELQRLRVVEEALDQCWDLLRRRRAARDNDENPDAVQPRSAQQVQRYLQ